MFEKELLNDKSIIVTGGGTGLGKSMATRFAELGANLVITSRRQEVIDSLTETLSLELIRFLARASLSKV